jgi:hypothetical protein
MKGQENWKFVENSSRAQSKYDDFFGGEMPSGVEFAFFIAHAMD